MNFGKFIWIEIVISVPSVPSDILTSDILVTQAKGTLGTWPLGCAFDETLSDRHALGAFCDEQESFSLSG